PTIMKLAPIRNTILKIFISALIILSANQRVTAQQQDKYLTWYEINGYNKTPRYLQTVEYCKLLAQNSKMVTYTSIGTSPQGREIPLLILDRDGLTDPQQIRAKGRVV
ncbi:MAG TPA: hypothetical protein DDX10_09270, partial [Rikenellaceae bacterium]|nr:hypothetical protein [Rikenellaceae bacterium]